MREALNPSLIVLACALSTVALTGCESMPVINNEPSEDRTVEVVLYNDCSGEDEVAMAVASRDDRARDAIKHMQNEDYDKAIDLLETLLDEKPEDHRSLFALGVCYEFQGRYEEAVDLYKRANLAESDPKYQAARIRAECSL